MSRSNKITKLKYTPYSQDDSAKSSHIEYREKLVAEAKLLGVSTKCSNKDLKLAIKDARKKYDNDAGNRYYRSKARDFGLHINLRTTDEDVRVMVEDEQKARVLKHAESIIADQDRAVRDFYTVISYDRMPSPKKDGTWLDYELGFK